MPCPSLEPTNPHEMTALAKDPDRLALLMHQRAEPHLIEALNLAVKAWSQDKINEITGQLVENLLYQGRHDDARKFAMSDSQRELIDGHQHAIERPDDERCECEHKPTPEKLLQHAVVRKSWSDTHGTIVFHYWCGCGHTNASDRPPHIGHDIVAAHRKELEAEMRAHFKRGGSHTNLPPAAKAIQTRMVAAVTAAHPQQR